jgi:hypothetical protein
MNPLRGVSGRSCKSSGRFGTSVDQFPRCFPPILRGTPEDRSFADPDRRQAKERPHGARGFLPVLTSVRVSNPP